MPNAEDAQNSRHACAACKHQRRKCENNCVFAPHFPAARTENFQKVHRIFGVKNVTRLLKDLNPEERKRAVISLEWEASEWEKNKVDGPLARFTELEKELQDLRRQQDENNFNNNNNSIVPYSNYQNSSGLIEMNHNAAEPGFVSNPNFDFGTNNISNLGFVAPYNTFGGLPPIRTNSNGNQELRDHCIQFNPNYYSRIPQAQERSLVIRERGGAGADNVVQPSTPNQMMGNSSSMLSPPNHLFTQQNYQPRGSQPSVHGYFKGAASHSQGRGLQ